MISTYLGCERSFPLPAAKSVRGRQSWSTWTSPSLFWHNTAKQGGWAASKPPWNGSYSAGKVGFGVSPLLRVLRRHVVPGWPMDHATSKRRRYWCHRNHSSVTSPHVKIIHQTNSARAQLYLIRRGMNVKPIFSFVTPFFSHKTPNTKLPAVRAWLLWQRGLTGNHRPPSYFRRTMSLVVLRCAVPWLPRVLKFWTWLDQKDLAGLRKQL